MKVRNLTVGPILGATMVDSVRIFGRAELEIEHHRPRKAHGVMRIRKLGEVKFSEPVYFKMNPNFDMTGIAVVSKLQGNTRYQYQMGWIFSDVDSDKVDVTAVLDWNDITAIDFRTASPDSHAPRVLATGSCRYALRLFGGVWFDDRGDKTFRSILDRLTKGKEIHQFIMCGDQIYADDLNVVGADTRVDVFNDRYRKVFTTPHLRKLMAQVPTYMTLDDHEIENDWPASASNDDWVTKFPAAIHAYSTYQASHSPLFATSNGRLEGTPTHLWYTYQDGCCDVFVCDTRTERLLDYENPEIIGPLQMQKLLEWLRDGSERVKIIVTSVPPYESESDDKWHGFVYQRDLIFNCIRENQVKKVVFLSGDVHACMSSELAFDGEDLKVISVVSSAFFWPYPHPKRRGFKLTGLIQTKSNNRYRVKKASAVYPTDAFAMLSVSPQKLGVEFVSRKGDVLGRKTYTY